MKPSSVTSIGLNDSLSASEQPVSSHSSIHNSVHVEKERSSAIISYQAVKNTDSKGRSHH